MKEDSINYTNLGIHRVSRLTGKTVKDHAEESGRQLEISQNRFKECF